MDKSNASNPGSLIGRVKALFKLSMNSTIIRRLSIASPVLLGRWERPPLVLYHDEQAVLCAVELTLDAGVATKTQVLKILHRFSDAKAPPALPIDAPQALRLAQEPVANVERFNGLLAWL